MIEAPGIYHFYLSRHHRKARDTLREQIKGLTSDAEDQDKVAAYCVAIVTTATCFVECRINEFWFSILNNGRDNWGLTSDQREQFKNHAKSDDWKMRSILEKYQVALDILGLPTFDNGGSPYQDAATLVMLRNEIVHNEPHKNHMIDGKRVSPRPKLEARLATAIGACPYNGLKDMFPDNCLHHGCAEWASETSQKFVDEFLRRTGASTQTFVSSAEFRM